MSDGAGYLLGGIMTAAILLGLVIGGAYLAANLKEQADCNRYREFTGRETRFKWAWGNSCYVKTENGWFLLDQVRDVAP